ncbi:MAG TPA: GIY-YIG nuclease family protein [Allosphingosinicella sp.]|jgi:putative endonuclease
MKQPVVYIMASRRNDTIYTGVTSDLPKRVWQHKSGTSGFTARYGCKLLVWYELHGEMLPAIAREKQLKGGSRKRKLALIEAMNPEWKDLYESIVW